MSGGTIIVESLDPEQGSLNPEQGCTRAEPRKGCGMNPEQGCVWTPNRGHWNPAQGCGMNPEQG